MFAFAIFSSLLINSILASNDIPFGNNWIPIAKPIEFHQARNSYIERRLISAWKPSQDIDNSNIDYVKENAIQIITPEQAQIIQYEKSVHSAAETATSTDAATTSTTAFSGNLKQNEYKISAEQLDQKDIKEKDAVDSNLKQDVSKEMHGKYIIPGTHRRVSKQLRDSTEALLSTAQNKPGEDTVTADTNISKNFRNATNNNYEITEQVDVLEQHQNTEDENLGYIYQPPPVIPGLPATQNELTNKLVTFLSKYNIKSQDMLNNYARSKQHVNKKVSYHVLPMPLVPFRYNSLNHHPVDPVLAVLLSNYGYYLQGFYGLQNNYKNLYGYSASNNIHNNKPFGSYKIFSDTDFSN